MSARHRGAARFPGVELPFCALCRDCPRLAAYLDRIRTQHPGYHAAPVASFGDPRARLLIVGLAPGLHGANRTGRPFTGDYAGILLYDTLHRVGLASHPTASGVGDGMRLSGCRITNAVKCLPPQNRPQTDEIARCNRYLRAELAALGSGALILALGRVAHSAVLKALALRARDFMFSHGARHVVPGGLTLYDSYHCSRYNTQTRRLTPAMFRTVVDAIVGEMAASSHC